MYNFKFYVLKISSPVSFQIPSRKYFSDKLIPSMYQATRIKLQEELDKQILIAITTDAWTSRAVENYTAVTAHYITDDWIMKSTILETKVSYDAHTGDNLAEHLKKSVADWNIERPGMILPIVTDNASNIEVGVRESGYGPHVRCFAHTLNLAAKKALAVPTMNTLLARIRKIVKYFRKSTTAAGVLKQKQKLLELPEHRLMIDVDTRWNSSFDMVRRYLDQQPSIAATLVSPSIRKDDKDIDTLTDNDILNAERVMILLKPLKTMTTSMCEEKSPTLSLIHPLLNQLRESMTVHDERDPPIIKQMKAAIKQNIDKRYSEPDIQEMLLLCTALDPRFLALPYVEPYKRDEVFRAMSLGALCVNSIQCPYAVQVCIL